MTTTATPTTFSRYPMLWLAVCFAAGIVTAKIVGVDARVLVAVGASTALLAFLFRTKIIAPAFIVVAFVAAGAASFQVELSGVRSNRLKALYDSGVVKSGSPVEAEGV